MSAPTRQRVVVLSDLHMAVPDGPIGAPAACYFFGHTHVAEHWLRFIEIEHGVGRPATARLGRWRRT